jgi:N6-L-threonylcarbamoyladenine synthase
MKILAIDTSCDETSVAISNGNMLLCNVVSSSMEFQSEWGGVVPIIAKRNHVNRIDKVVNRALTLAKVQIENIDAFAVTYGPGLAIALEVGVAKCKQLAEKYNKPMLAVNHMAGHVYSNFAVNAQNQTYSGLNAENPEFPVLVLLISGGHTELVLMKDHMNFEIVGKTLDDSVGEAFDKIARMLNLGYPGGPIIEKLAIEGDEAKFNFPIAMARSGDLNFSYSGLKTAVLQKIKELGKQVEKKDIPQPITKLPDEPYAPSISKKPVYELSKQTSMDIAAAFQKAAAGQLIIKTIAAVKQFGVKNVLLGGGVVNNLYIRSKLRKELKNIGAELYFPQNKKLLTDNAGMIAVAAYYMAQKQLFADISKVDRKPNLELGS